MRAILTGMRSEIDRRMVGVGLTDAQWAPMLFLHTGDACTAAELARCCMQNAAGMTRLLDRLEAKGLIVRRRSRDDRRVIHIELTEDGRQAVEVVPALLREVNQLAMQGFSEQEVAQFKGYLQRILSTIENAGWPQPACASSACADEKTV